jgi:hypothetical protein
MVDMLAYAATFARHLKPAAGASGFADDPTGGLLVGGKEGW